MILTVTLNPAVDISYTLEQLSLDTVNRVDVVSKSAGGKGLNVARVLNQLGADVAATGFLGGSLGGFIRTELNAMGIQDLFVPIKDETRNCIGIIHEGKQTEILESGPELEEDEAALFLEKFADFSKQATLLTLSGSLPKGLPTDFYQHLVRLANSMSVPVLLDTNGALLTSIIASEHKPYLIKPNAEELADLLGLPSVTEVEIIEALQSSLFKGIEWIVVTLGADGAIVKNGKIIFRATTPNIHVVNAVGSGDSVIAGFALGITRDLPVEELIKFGLAMGVLNALERKTGHINVDKIDWAMKNITVQKVDGLL